MARIERDAQPELNQLAAMKVQQGFFGFFGDQHNKPGNIAGAVALLATAALFASCFVPLPDDLPRLQVLTTITGIITTAMAYMFGRSGSSDK